MSKKVYCIFDRGYLLGWSYDELTAKSYGLQMNIEEISKVKEKELIDIDEEFYNKELMISETGVYYTPEEGMIINDAIEKSTEQLNTTLSCLQTYLDTHNLTYNERTSFYTVMDIIEGLRNDMKKIEKDDVIASRKLLEEFGGVDIWGMRKL